ncbi:Transcription factor S-II (TFIIS), central domain [Seminavis robusta]|uniref:Transcription factor S-II (TFIIS), central domain n=1 Tax=Seminavis robusta TaxID=568900 RepID=A0A9N8HHN2_9STRA|nr:Transcription factor S-II (TFIIS), central domain [Seminavis robusta]|eukprot:Sro648_g181040.1 Transcription factor S-II (TFIIS), central domain (1962) ;mRNA; r:21975-28157
MADNGTDNTSNDATTSTGSANDAAVVTLEEWANSLVGRDWEIFWADDGCCEKQQGHEEEEEESEDVEDWYDGHIDQIEELRDGNYSFRVRFVGDDTIYSMVLVPGRVRPSVRAWIKRSKAILGNQALAKTIKSVVDWENALPIDTRTLQDTPHLDILQNQIEQDTINTDNQHALMENAQQQHDTGDNATTPAAAGEARDLPEIQEFEEIKRLSYLLRSQQYLRTRLAPIGEEDNEGPSEAYVTHLLQCLTYLEQACQWYIASWKLHHTVFFNDNSQNDSTQQPTLLGEDFAVQRGLQEGRKVITQLLRVDTSLAGSKRRRPAENSPGGTRKTKRRRRNKSLMDYIKESERGCDTPNPEEDEFLSAEAVSNFVKQIQSNDNRWYTKHFGKMMQSLSSNIVEPLQAWRKLVEVALGEREATMEDTEGETSEDDEKSDDEGNPGPQQLKIYTHDEIEALLTKSNHDDVLRHFNLSRWQDRLRQKLSAVDEFETRCRTLLSLVYSKPEADISTKENDSIYQELGQLKARAASPTSSVANVSVSSQQVLDDAVAIRSWYLDLHRIEHAKERLVFVEQMATRASQLPRLSPTPTSSEEGSASTAPDPLFEQAVARLNQISQGHFDHLARFNEYRSILISRMGATETTDKDFTKLESVQIAVQELAKVPVLSMAEEMLLIRRDVLVWKSRAEQDLFKTSISFNELLAFKKSLDLILAGRSETRIPVIATTEANDEVNAEIRSFAADDVNAFCGTLVAAMNTKYTGSCAWKDRADAIIGAIKHHREQSTGSSQKTLAMVDLKRVSGLLREYEDLEIQFPEERSFLEDVSDTATKWSQDLLDFARDESRPLSELRLRLQETRQVGGRPAGIIIDPARHIVDVSLELLQWHKILVDAMKEATGYLRENQLMGKAAELQNSSSLFLLVSEGREILQVFADETGQKHMVDPTVALQLMSKALDSRRPMRVLARAKLESHPLCGSILDRLIREDEREGLPLKFLLLVYWNASVSDFVEKFGNKHETGTILTLVAAKNLMLERPILANSEGWGFLFSTREEQFVDLISRGDRLENEATKMLGAAKELLRGSWKQMEAIQIHLTSLQQILRQFRASFTKVGTVLALDKQLEQQLDYHSRVFGWVTRTFGYNFLHQVGCDLFPEKRISWDVLVALNERKPNDLEKMGDCAAISLRISELFEAASKWQEEITKVTKLSFRGGKRRGDVAPGADNEGAPQQTVSVETVYRLAKDPVLQTVAMPREAAVAEMLESARAFETHLHNFLGKDYAGADRAPYPNTRSLMGRSGEFLLYRLVGGSLYSSLTASLESISTMAQDVFADTPGKAAFEWIRKSVAWIESLRAAVTQVSYTADTVIERLVVTEADARAIWAAGKCFFLDIPEDLKKTLSAHRIFVSTNKTAERLKVVFKKGGAHHSVGGTVVRWLPILFDSLREDLKKLDSWKQSVTEVQKNFQDYSDERNGVFSDNDMTHLLGLSDEVAMLIEEGIGSLVVAPSKDVIDSMGDLQARLQEVLKRHQSSVSCGRINRFENPSDLVQDRFELCDALLARSSLEYDASDDAGVASHNLTVREGTFRETCRSCLKQSLVRAAELMGIHSTDDLVDLTLFASKAYDIEQEMFSRFQIAASANVMSNEYKTKARNLRWAFEYCVNPKLCLRVLLGEVEASELVSMTDEELVGDWKAPPGQVADVSDSQKRCETPPSEESSTADADSGAPNGSALNEGVPAISEATPEFETELKTEDIQEPTLLAASGSNDTASSMESFDPAGDSVSIQDRPDAPPSLAVSLVKSSLPSRKLHNSKTPSSSKASKKSKYLTGTSGRDAFVISVSKPIIKFKARFYTENDRQAGLNGLLPESFQERGRLRVDEFSKFVSGKLKGGKWVAIPIRMTLCSDEDAKKHKAYYKMYESNKRIAICAISENTKLFLVTPKFQRAATKAMGSNFAFVETSTYAIVLTKERV